MDGGGEGRGGRVITREVVESERVGVGVKGVTSCPTFLLLPTLST